MHWSRWRAEGDIFHNCFLHYATFLDVENNILCIFSDNEQFSLALKSHKDNGHWGLPEAICIETLPKVTDGNTAKIIERCEHLWATNLNTINCSSFSKVQLPYQSFLLWSPCLLTILLFPCASFFFFFLSGPNKELTRLITTVDPFLKFTCIWRLNTVWKITFGKRTWSMAT